VKPKKDLFRIVAVVLVAAILCAAWFVLAQGSRLEDSVIIVGGDRSYPPYEFLDKDGKPAGFNVELTHAIGEVMGMNVEVRLGAWSEMRQRLDAGTIHVLQGCSYSEDRARAYDFCTPHARVHHAIYARRGSPSAKSLDDLRGKEVLLHKDGIMHDSLVRAGTQASLVLTETPAEALRTLASGKHDYAVVAMLPAQYLINQHGLSNVVPVAPCIATQKYCYAFKKGNSELLARFAEGLAILHETGKYQAIHYKWLGVTERPGLHWGVIARYIAMAMVPAFLLLGMTVLWSRTLQRKVAQRTEALTLEILERKRAEEELCKHQEQLIQADKMTALGILVSGVAHEINNPNGLILLNTPVIMEAFRDAGPILEDCFRQKGDFVLGGLKYSRMSKEIPLMLSEMFDGAKRIKRIVEDLKDFSRRSDSALTESVDMNSLVQTSVRLLDNLIRKSTSKFSVEYAENLPPVRANSQRIEQVIVNLVLNACQALPDREKGISLRTFRDRSTGENGLEVRDEGVGIPRKNLPRLTDPFFTTKRQAGGTGLGLSLSAAIVKEHSGSLAFSSEPGKGTTVRLSLPPCKESAL
jgi:signal transduction histidine kinase